MIKQIVFLLFSCNIFLNMHAMLKQYTYTGAKKSKYPLYHIRNDWSTSLDREILENLANLECFFQNELQQKKVESFTKKLIAEKYLYSARKATIEEEKYDCGGYALAKALGFKKNSSVSLELTPVKALNLFKYFKQTNNPKKNDLIFYFVTSSIPVTSHIGVVLENNKIESKWGTTRFIAEHEKSKLPFSYGNDFSFYTLKNKFRILPRSLLLNLMEYDAQANACKYRRKLNTCLLRYYSLIANSNTATALKLICEPLSTIELLRKG